ncbi:uncharacterized protein LOC141529420 [Cotesia typhae]|uniref:uncharacterized protein LOC141529420 n=1 Tax=Cotesia typhae TaxID=2053667 RepID=UPI003D68AAB6
MDIFAYVNSKVVYLEKHLRKEIVASYNDAIKQQCELEKIVRRNSLALASIAPAEFAFQFMKEQGYMASVTGEVIRISKCVPVEIKTRKTEECYQELPVTLGNGSFFMLPRTYLLVKTGNQIDCNTLTPTTFNINNAWYQILPQLTPTIEPGEISPNTKATWKYTAPEYLAKSGLCSDEDLSKLREAMMFPVERFAVVNTIARGATGRQINVQGINMNRFIDEVDIENKIKNMLAKIHGIFTVIGDYSSAIIAGCIIIKAFKFAADTVIHVLALHSVFGWSLRLLGSIWDSLTNFVLHSKQKYEKEKEQAANNPIMSKLTTVDIEEKDREKEQPGTSRPRAREPGTTKVDIDQTDKTVQRKLFP